MRTPPNDTAASGKRTAAAKKKGLFQNQGMERRRSRRSRRSAKGLDDRIGMAADAIMYVCCSLPLRRQQHSGSIGAVSMGA